MAATHIQIDGKAFPLQTNDPKVSNWSIAERGQKVEFERKRGFLGGAGKYISERPDDYLMLQNMDSVTFPYLRLAPAQTKIDLTGLGLNAVHPVYTFAEQDGSSNSYAYVLNGQYAWKIDLSDNSTGTRKDFGAGAICGRPGLFKGKWHIPLGAAVDYVTLDTIAVGDAANSDTWTTVSSQKALHFATTQKTQQEMLARAYSTNLIDLSSNGTSWQGDDFEVPTTSDISDLLSAGGELVILSAEGMFLMNPDGQAVRVLQSFVTGLTGKDSRADFIGANSHQHGRFTYWAHSTGIHRFIAQTAQAPVGLDADEQWVNRTLDAYPFLLPATGGWRSVAVAGTKWLYATNFDKLFAGEILPDGKIKWHGCIWVEPDGDTIRVSVTEGQAVTSAPILWVADTSQDMHKFTLAQDGSFRDALGTGRSTVSRTHRAWLGEVRAPRKAQWRVLWVEVEGDVGAQQPVQLGAHMDGAATSTAVGATITATGRTERAWTVGTSDFANFIIPVLKVATGASFGASEDLRIRAWGGWGLTPNIYRCMIDLRTEALSKSSQDFKGALKLLRDMVNGVGVTVIEPETEESFTGYVEGMGLEMREDGAVVSLFIAAYEWNTS